MATPPPLMSGKDAVTIFMLGNSKVEFLSKTWEVKEDAVEAHDDVNGEDRTRDQKIINGYDITLGCFMENMRLLEALIADSQQRDTRTQPQDASLGFLLRPSDGSRKGFAGKEITVGAWTWANSGRTERMMINFPLRARYLEKVPTI